jgi:hypothetical protein
MRKLSLLIILLLTACVTAPVLDTADKKLAAAYSAQTEGYKLIKSITVMRKADGSPLVSKANLQLAQDCLTASGALLDKAELFYHQGIGSEEQAAKWLEIGLNAINVSLVVLQTAYNEQGEADFHFTCASLEVL